MFFDECTFQDILDTMNKMTDEDRQRIIEYYEAKGFHANFSCGILDLWPKESTILKRAFNLKGEKMSPSPRLERAIQKGPEWSCAIRQVMMPADANMYQTIFGGLVLSLIDQAAFVEARRHGMHIWVTASVERVDFKRPIRIGDTVSLYTMTTETGTSSVKIAVCVEVHRYDTNQVEEVTTAGLTMVSVDKDGKPIPFSEPSTL